MNKKNIQKNNKNVAFKSTTNYPVGDFIARYKNASMADAKSFSVRNTRMIMGVAKTLEKLGYVSNPSLEDGYLTLSIVRKNKRSVLTEIKLVSKPGLRIYSRVDELEKRRKPSTLILSTPKGILSLSEAIKQGVGGEVIAEVL